MMKIFFLLFLWQPFHLLVESIWIKEMENKDLFEGDIILDPDQIHANGSIAYGSMIGGRWPLPIPYKFGRDMQRQPSGMKVIKEAIAQYHKYTCIRFKPRTDEKSYMQFDWAPGCASSVGHRPHKVSRINLDAPCWELGIVMHEMGHSLGLWHEQSRPDRDNYVKIIWDNIKEEHKHNFNKRTYKEIDSLGTPYDLESMMHYATSAFTSSGGRTIEVLDYNKRLLIGQRRGFSNIDVAQLNLMYKCPVFRGTVPPKICKDSGVYNCEHLKSRGHCHRISEETRMYRECCKTCFGHVAGGGGGKPQTYPPTPKKVTKRPTQPAKTTIGGGCVDKEDKGTCAYWARLGNCESLNKTLREFVLNNCCATCKAHGHHK